MINIDEIKRIREITGCGLKVAKDSWINSSSIEEAIAKANLGLQGIQPIRQERFTYVETYTHQNRIGVGVKVSCVTDFCASSSVFKSLVKDILFQIATTKEFDRDTPFVKNENVTIGQYLDQVSGILKERIIIEKFFYLE